MLELKTFLALLLTLLLTISSYSLANPNLLEGDMGLASSTPGTPLIDGESINSDAPPLPRLSPAQAASLVRAKVGGQIMSVNSQQGESGVIYGVKVLNGGRMRVIKVDGQTGQLLNQ